MKSSRTLIAAAVAVLVAGAAVANDPYDKDKSSSKSGATFDTLDTNRDGRISRAEAVADSKIVFSTADADGDGYLDAGEFKKAMKSSMESDSSMPKPQSDTMPSDASGTEPTIPQDQSAAPPSDTETPRQ
jgi:hypothetical protein